MEKKKFFLPTITVLLTDSDVLTALDVMTVSAYNQNLGFDDDLDDNL